MRGGGKMGISGGEDRTRFQQRRPLGDEDTAYLCRIIAVSASTTVGQRGKTWSRSAEVSERGVQWFDHRRYSPEYTEPDIFLIGVDIENGVSGGIGIIQLWHFSLRRVRCRLTFASTVQCSTQQHVQYSTLEYSGEHRR